MTGFALFEGPTVVTAGVRTGEARIGVNGVNVNGEVRLPWEARVAPSLFCVCASAGGGVACSESNCSRDPERLPRSFDNAGIE